MQLVEDLCFAMAPSRTPSTVTMPKTSTVKAPHGARFATHEEEPGSIFLPVRFLINSLLIVLFCRPLRHVLPSVVPLPQDLVQGSLLRRHGGARGSVRIRRLRTSARPQAGRCGLAAGLDDMWLSQYYFFYYRLRPPSGHHPRRDPP